MTGKSILNGLEKLSRVIIVRHEFMIAGYVVMDYLVRFIKLQSLRDHSVKFKCECGYTFNAKLRDWWRFLSHFEPKTSAFLRKNVSREDIVLDVGAHIGIHTIHLAKIAKFVYAIEPEPDNLKLLFRNIFVNNIEKKVSVLPYALSSINGLVNFCVSSESTGAHHILFNSKVGDTRHKTILNVKAYTLDTLLLNILRLDHVDVVKIDVEGHELEVIKGAKEMFQRIPPRIIVVETKRGSEVLKILTDKYNYKLVHILDCWNNTCNYAFSLK